jgi:hypothetical protein
MNTQRWEIERALDEVSASSAGGAPFLIAFGFTLFTSAIVSYFVPIHVAAVIVLFQGNLALPLAFWLERRLAHGTMSADNPLKSLSILMAMSQIVGLPAVFLAYNLHPAYAPAALAAIGGVHFLPYAWLHRTRIYTILGVAISAGAFAIAVVAKRDSLPWVLFYMSILYWIAVPFLMIHARRIAPAARVPA